MHESRSASVALREALLLCRTLLLLFAAGAASAELEPDAPIDCRSCEAWNQPHAAFRIFGDTWYVGTAGLSVILIDTGEGLVLLDGGLPQTASAVEAHLESLGHSIGDVRVIALSHAHYDHAGGIAAIQRASGARVVASRHAAAVLEAGELPPDDPQYGSDNSEFPPSTVVGVVEDGTPVRIGDLVLRAVYTPGHTPGGTSWTWRQCEGDRCLDIVYADSLGAIGPDTFRFSDGAADDLRDSAARIAALDCDIMLAPHPFIFGMDDKLAVGGDAFVDDTACRDYADAAIEQLEKRLDAER